jgi:cytochrome c551/c552
MSRFSKLLPAAVIAGTLAAGTALAADLFSGIGRPATEAEIRAWDIDVRPDFLGLPAGSGTVEQGEVLWEQKCASCHGSFGEANTTFTPLVGGTTAEDMKTGRVANLRREDYPQRTTLMKVPHVATLFDYVRRAMPWTSPKSLTDDEVYAVLAYMLNLGDVVPADFELNDRTIREVQAILPNRNGMTTAHGMWPGPGLPDAAAKPDVAGDLCMKDCKTEVRITSSLPEHAWPAHGNLAIQTRVIGPVRGRVTGEETIAFEDPVPGPLKLAETAGCLACHGVSQKIVGPAYSEIAFRYRDQDVLTAVLGRVRDGAEGIWGSIPMPPQTDVSEEDLRTIVSWILEGAK